MKFYKDDKVINIFNIIFICSIIIFLIMAFISFITVPVTGDIKVFIAAANQAKYKDSKGILSIFEAWELKGIANRLLMYFIYSVSGLFVSYGKVTTYELVVKTIYAVILVLIIVISVCLLAKDIKQRIKYFLIVYFAFFATFTASQLQVEMTCVLLMLFIMACIVHCKRWSLIMAGFIGSFFFFFKSIFFLLFISVLSGIAVYTDERKVMKKDYFISLVSGGFSQLFLIVMVKMVYPQEFKDMSAAAEYQSTLFSAGSAKSLVSVLDSFTNTFNQSVITIPFLLVAILCFIIVLIKFVRTRQWIKVFAFILCWIIPSDIIIVSNRYFIYHYFLLVFPGLISVFAFLKYINTEINSYIIFIGGCIAFISTIVCWKLKKGYNQTGIINYSSLMVLFLHLLLISLVVYCINAFIKYQSFVCCLILSVCLFLWMNYSSVISPKYRNMKELDKYSMEICEDVFPKDFCEKPVLFLDGGAAPFYIDVPSYSRYFFNLPLQRWQEGKEWEIQEQEYNLVMNYTGKYILYSNWIGIEKYPELKQKIDNEYEKIPYSGLFVYSPEWNVFILNEPSGIQEIQNSNDVYIMIRKNNHV